MQRAMSISRSFLLKARKWMSLPPFPFGTFSKRAIATQVDKRIYWHQVTGQSGVSVAVHTSRLLLT